MEHKVTELRTSQIVPGTNDRTIFDPAALQELASSIKTYGLAQPITVRTIVQCGECLAIFTDRNAPAQCPNCGSEDLWSAYQIVAGERRYRAIDEILQWPSIPAIIRDLDDEQASAIMLAENVARADLDPIDEACAYQNRIDNFGWSVKDCADKAGVSAVRVRFRLKLLTLRGDLQKLIRDDNLPLGYAQILADGHLDANRQMIALAHLRDNPSPTPTWFRRIVGKLVEDQDQESLFDTDAFFVAQEIGESGEAQLVEPPHPSTTTPPAKGKTLRQIVQNQVDFWADAAAAWDRLGKPFKRQECESAAKALTLALAAA